MKKAALIVVAALGLVAGVFMWLRNEEAVATSAARPWPGGMGKLDAVAERWPKLQANGASVKLTALADALPKSEAADDFVARELTRGELTINEPPALADVSAIRELLLREAVVWESDDGIGGGNEMKPTLTGLPQPMPRVIRPRREGLQLPLSRPAPHLRQPPCGRGR